MALNAPYTPSTIIQSTQVSNDLVGLGNGTNDTANNSMATYRSESNFDYVASGCVWSGDAYASTRNGSQTAGVVYIAGVRLPVASVSAHLFTASKDTYIDINGSGVQVYTEATNNAASPALAAGSIRIGIIITGASSIAAATSVNQGQESMILPIASSIAYSVTDSLGNLICGRDINRKLLGYKQILANFTTSSASAVQITGLSCPVIVPTGRKIKVSFVGIVSNGTAADGSAVTLWDGVVSAGTQIQQISFQNPSANLAGDATMFVVVTPTTASKTYNAGLGFVTGGTAQLAGAATIPPAIMVELA